MIPLSKMIETIGNDKVGFQMLNSSIINASQGKGHTKITFGTQELSTTDVALDKGKIGMVVWIERDDFDKFVKDNIK